MEFVFFILDKFNSLFSFVASLYGLFRRSQVESSDTPFSVVPIDELISNLSSPLKVTPERIERGLQNNFKPGMHIFLGTSGVGKTREAAEFAHKLSNVSGANIVYLAKGHISPTAPLPQQKDVKRVIVMIDDYDLGIESAASNTFLEREAAYKEALANLGSLYTHLKSQIELHALIVTINKYRLPISSFDINNILPECELLELPPVTHKEFSDFILAAAQVLDLSLSDEIVKLLAELCDGRFDTIAIFLNSFDKGAEIHKSAVQKFSDNLSTVWLIFKENLSDEQKSIYEKIKILKDFKLPPRIKYVQSLLESDNVYMKEKEVRRAIASVWSIEKSQAIIYDGQFGSPEYSLDLSKWVIVAVLRSSGFRRNDRYSFQEEAKALGSLLTKFTPSKIHLRMLRRLCRWYPRDRYFAYLLALAYATHGKYFRGIVVLYRMFRQYDDREMLFGKWIVIKMHLLLADLFICQEAKKRSKRRHWIRYKFIEKEFKLAILSADADFRDLTLADYGEPIQLKGRPDPNINMKQLFDNEHKELGLDVPLLISVDRKLLRAMAHHKYAEYLLGEFHREYDAIKHEEIVIELLPEYGEAYLNCARACLGIGDTKRALVFAEHAGLLPPQNMDAAFYEFCVSQAKWASFYDIGDLSAAKKWFNECYELSQKESLYNSREFKSGLEYYRVNSDIWVCAEQLASLRQKEFGEKLFYRIPTFNIELCLPGDWKIDEDSFSGDTLMSSFAPTATWDETAQCPVDASIDVVYTTRQMELDAKSFGEMLLQPVGKMSKVEKILIEGPITFDEITFYSWNFKIPGSWPKEGILMSFALPTARVHIRLMCQTCGKHIFWPIFTSVVEAFTQKLINRPYSLPQLP